MIPEAFIQELLNRVDIIDVIDKAVPLKKAGANYSACCPFHNEKSPSFTVSPAKQFYHCFGCGAHGSALGFLMEYQGLAFVEAVNELAKTVGMIVPQETRAPDAIAQKLTLSLQTVLQQAAQFYRAELKNSSRAIEYLKSRGLSGQIAAKFQVGYAPAGWQNLQGVFPHYEDDVLATAGLVVENEQGRRYDRFRDRIMFPIHNQKGEVIGFGGRVINPEDTPKYYNSPETPLFQKGHELYGLFLARRAIRDAACVLVVEGYMDVVALAQYDIHYAVAALGTATTPFHITKLMRQTEHIVFCFDGDNAGRTAAWRAAMNALPAITDSLRLSFLFLPDQHDPDSYVREFGKEKFEAEMKNAMPLSRYITQHLSADNALQSQEDKVRFMNDAEPILKQINAPRFSLLLRKRVAELAGISETEMQSMMHLDSPKKANNKARTGSVRSPVSLKKKFILMALMRPDLVHADDAAWAVGALEEDALLRQTITLALAQPQSKPVVLLRNLSAHINANVLADIEKALHALDDTVDVASEIEGARMQLRQSAKQNQSKQWLEHIKEKPLQSLSAEERELLKQFGVK